MIASCTKRRVERHRRGVALVRHQEHSADPTLSAQLTEQLKELASHTLPAVIVSDTDLVDEHHPSVAVAANQLVGDQLPDRLSVNERGELIVRLSSEKLSGACNRVSRSLSRFHAVLLEMLLVERELSHDVFVADSQPPHFDRHTTIVGRVRPRTQREPRDAGLSAQSKTADQQSAMIENGMPSVSTPSTLRVPTRTTLGSGPLLLPLSVNEMNDAAGGSMLEFRAPGSSTLPVMAQ